MSGANATCAELRGLSRTILLVRDHLRPDVHDDQIADALLSCRVGIVADERALRSTAAQHATVSAALLCARSGASVKCFLPSVGTVGVSAPLIGADFSASLSDLLQDLIRQDEAATTSAGPFDLLIIVGRPRRLPAARRAVWIAASDWMGSFGPEPIQCDWGVVTAPFGALAAAGLCAGEVLKIAVRRLHEFAIDPGLFHQFFAPSVRGQVSLAPADTPAPCGELGRIDLISGGAISETVLYTLARIPNATAEIRLVEPEKSDETNLNRYALLRRSQVESSKALTLVRQAEDGALGGLRIQPQIWRYDESTSERLLPLAPRVLLGVDHIPTRWLIQKQWPAWLGIGATSHYDAMASIHRPADEGCAGCAHPVDDPADGPLPTVAVVTHWAGLLLAAYLARDVSGFPIANNEQMTYCFPLQIANAAGIWRSAIARNQRCPVHSAGGI